MVSLIDRNRRASRWLLWFVFIFLTQQCVAQSAIAKERRSVQELIEMLGSDDRDKRRDAAHTLADYGPGAEEALPALIEALKDRDIQIWHDTTQAIAHLGPNAASALDALVLNMDSGDDQRRFRTAYAIGSLGKVALPAMRERLTEKSGNIREVAVRAIGQMGPEATVATAELIERLADKGEHIRELAVNSLAQIGPSSVEELQAALTNDIAEIRAGAAKALASIGTASRSALPKLMKMSSSDSEATVRANSVAALGRIAPSQSQIVHPLITALQDESNAVKRAAVEAWIPVSPQIQVQATNELAKLLGKQDDALRTGVLLILNRFGPRGEAATSTLLDELTKSPNSTEITTTLGQIGKPALEPTYAALREERIGPTQMARIIQGMPSTLKREIAKKTHDKSPIVRELAATTIGELVPFPRDGVDLLTSGLTDDSLAVRKAAANSVRLIGKKAKGVDATLSKAIAEEEDADVCALMLQAFAAIKPDEDVLLKCLTTSLEHPALSIRITTLTELSQLDELPKSMQGSLSKQLEQPEPQVRALAAESLSLIKSARKESAELLLPRLDDESPLVQQRTMKALARFGDEASPAVKRIQEHLDSDSDETRVAAIESLSRLGKRSHEALPKFGELSQSGSEVVRNAALSGVRKIAKDPDDAVQILVAGLKDTEWTIRRTVAQELGELEERAALAVPALLNMMKNDKESDVARRAIREIGTADEDALPTLTEILQDKNSGRRPQYYSLYIMRQMGSKAKSALPLLKELREKSDGSMADQFDRTIDALEEDE